MNFYASFFNFYNFFWYRFKLKLFIILKRVTGDRLECELDDQAADWSKINVPHSRTHYIIDGLLQSTSYVLCMVAFNSYGRSEVTRNQIVTTQSKWSPFFKGHIVLTDFFSVFFCFLLLFCFLPFCPDTLIFF